MDYCDKKTTDQEIEIIKTDPDDFKKIPRIFQQITCLHCRKLFLAKIVNVKNEKKVQCPHCYQGIRATV